MFVSSSLRDSHLKLAESPLKDNEEGIDSEEEGKDDEEAGELHHEDVAKVLVGEKGVGDLVDRDEVEDVVKGSAFRCVNEVRGAQ